MDITVFNLLDFDALHGFAASTIAFISHERKHIVIQFLIINIQLLI